MLLLFTAFALCSVMPFVMFLYSINDFFLIMSLHIFHFLFVLVVFVHTVGWKNRDCSQHASNVSVMGSDLK